MAVLSQKSAQEYGKDLVVLRFACLGNGTNNMTVFRQAGGNVLLSCVRSGVGLYTLTFRDDVPYLPQKLVDARIVVHPQGASAPVAATDAMQGYIRDLSITGRTALMYLLSSTGAFADPAAGDWVTVALYGSKSAALAAVDAQ